MLLLVSDEVEHEDWKAWERLWLGASIAAQKELEREGRPDPTFRFVANGAYCSDSGGAGWRGTRQFCNLGDVLGTDDPQLGVRPLMYDDGSTKEFDCKFHLYQVWCSSPCPPPHHQRVLTPHPIAEHRGPCQENPQLLRRYQVQTPHVCVGEIQDRGCVE